MEINKTKKKYVSPQAEVLGMDNDGCLLTGSWKNVTVSGTRDNYSGVENLDGSIINGSRDGYGGVENLDGSAVSGSRDGYGGIDDM